MTVPQLELTPLEVASGLVSGIDPTPLRTAPKQAFGPLQALEEAIRPCLLRPPCMVTFSGGRDSSAVLAVAVQLARREGLPLPVPVTNRFPGIESTNETAWQEQVIRALDLRDWVKLDHDDELDCLGPVATRTMRRHGLLWPFNAHFVVPLIKAARGGSLLTGVGGDELLGETHWARAATVLAGRERPTLRDGRRIALAAAPRWVRRPVLAPRVDVDLPWLRGEAIVAIREAWVTDSVDEPFRWEKRIRWNAGYRYLRVCETSLGLLAEEEHVTIVHPLHDHRFVDALSALPRTGRFFSRTEAMRMLFENLLPEEVLARQTKSSFDAAFFNRNCRAFAADWDGSGVDDALVDGEELRRIWHSPTPDARSFLLLQSLWLSQIRATEDSGTSALDEQLRAVG